MSRRDYRHREPKKAKKEPKKLFEVSITQTPVNVELIKKKKRKNEIEEEK